MLITAEPGKESQVFNKLSEIDQIKEAHQVYGVYDIIIQIQTETMIELKNLISFNLRLIENIDSTLTMVCT